MNLADHFFQDDFAFVTYAELSAWCEKHGFLDPASKRQLLDCLLQSGGRYGRIKWASEKEQRAILGFGLLDNSLWKDKMFFGKGVIITEEKPT
jgi:hypothetical protein